MDINQRVEELKIVPVVVLQEVKEALPLAQALIDGGLPVAEVTFRTAAAADSIQAIREAYPDMLVGAGTVVNTEQAKKAMEAGAQFLVTPGFSKEVVQFAVINGLTVFPGCCTPTEIVMAMEFGLKVVKFFPASRYGGLETIKALGGPFPQIRFMPTGGINVGNIKEYLASPKVIACGGSWMVKEDLIRDGKFDEITKLTKEAMTLVKA